VDDSDDDRPASPIAKTQSHSRSDDHEFKLINQKLDALTQTVVQQQQILTNFFNLFQQSNNLNSSDICDNSNKLSDEESPQPPFFFAISR